MDRRDSEFRYCGRVERLSETTSDNERETRKINGGFEMPEIQVGEP